MLLVVVIVTVMVLFIIIVYTVYKMLTGKKNVIFNPMMRTAVSNARAHLTQIVSIT